MTLLAVSVASASEGFTHSNRVNNSTLYSWACVYNTPSSTFNTIKVRGIRADAGDVTTLSVYSTGAIPDDPATSEDDDETDTYLRSSLLVTSAQHTQTSSVDNNVYFNFPIDLSQANLGVSFTVVQDTVDSSGNRVATSEYRFSSLSSLSHYQSPNNNTSSSNADGGAGNVYYQTAAGGVWRSYSNDPPLAFELYFNEESLQVVSEAPSDATTVTASNSDFGSSNVFEWASTFNSPSSPFNTIIFRNASVDTAGDILELKIYKGYMPDLGTADDPSLTDRELDSNNLVETVRVTSTALFGRDYTFSLNGSYSSSNLTSQNAGDPPQFTAVITAFASDGTTVVDTHRVLYDPRAKSAPIFTSPNDYGVDTDSDNGGAGNTYYNNNAQTLWSHSGSTADRSLALDFYFEPRTPFGTVREITGNLTSPITNSIT